MADDGRTVWQPIADAPKDTAILVYTKPWGPIIALYNSEFREWTSRMQVPVSMKDEEELPTHWQKLPEPPEGATPASAGEAEGTNEAAATPVRMLAGSQS